MSDPDAKYHSAERVERDGVLVYAEGDEIPASDLDELRRQGHLDAEKPAAKPKAPAKKAARKA